MRNLLITICLLIQFTGCIKSEDPVEPIEYDFYYIIKDESNDDWFIKNSSTYDVKKLTVSDKPHRNIDKDSIFDNRTIFSLQKSTLVLFDSPTYFNYSNGDVDTLHFLVSPPEDKNHYNIVKKKFVGYFNGEKFGEWDFINNPDAFYDLEWRNCTCFFDKPDFNPVLFELVKRPESKDNR
jgi:hypothetical protein